MEGLKTDLNSVSRSVSTAPNLEYFTISTTSPDFEENRENLVSQAQSVLSSDTHPNSANLKDLDQIIDESMHATFLCQKTQKGCVFVGFSSVFKRSCWPEGLVRVLNRTYISPKFRLHHVVGTSTSFWLKNGLASRFFLPEQMEFCKKTNVNCIFISIEFLSRRKSMDLLVKKLNCISQGSNMWMILPDLMYTCPIDSIKSCEGNSSCWQNIAYKPMSDGKEELLQSLPQMQITQYNKIFGEPKMSQK